MRRGVAVPFRKRDAEGLRNISKLKASAVQAQMKQGLPLASGMEIGYVVKDVKKWEVDPKNCI